jgi:hypothetical protein
MATLEEYRSRVIDQKCRWCGADLPSDVEFYAHPEGWPVEGLEQLQWLFLTCPKCGYQWSLWKLGVSRHEQG